VCACVRAGAGMHMLHHFKHTDMNLPFLWVMKKFRQH
jgi:hypothetical protein